MTVRHYLKWSNSQIIWLKAVSLTTCQINREINGSEVFKHAMMCSCSNCFKLSHVFNNSWWINKIFKFRLKPIVFRELSRMFLIYPFLFHLLLLMVWLCETLWGNSHWRKGMFLSLHHHKKPKSLLNSTGPLNRAGQIIAFAI